MTPNDRAIRAIDDAGDHDIPGYWTALREGIAKAILEEREACAKIAEAMFVDCRFTNHGNKFVAGEEIAQAIRYQSKQS